MSIHTPLQARSRRVLWEFAGRITTDYNGDGIEEPRRKSDVLSDARLVGSLTHEGTHAPAIDLDIPAELVTTSAGTTLWVDQKMSLLCYRRLLKTLHAAGLGGEERPRWRGWSRNERQHAWSLAAHDVVEDGSFHETLRSLGSELGLNSLEDAFFLARTTSEPVTVREGRSMRNPWPIPLRHGALLIPSTHNQHLYLDTELDGPDYVRVLQAMSNAGIVQRAFARMARNRGTSFLRLPWVSKSVLDGLDG